MSITIIATIVTGALFVLTFASGYWLSGLGRPLNTALLTIHKLIPIGAAVYVAVTAVRMQRAQTLPLGALPAVIAAAALLLATIATGGIVAATKEPPAVVATLHKIAPYLTAAAVAVFLVILTTRRS